MSVSPLSSSKNKILFSAIWLIWTLMHFKMLWQDFGIRWEYAAIDATLTNGLLVTTFLLVMINLRYYNPRKGKFVHLLVLTAAVSGLCLGLMQLGLKAIFLFDDSYYVFLEKSMPVRFDIAFLVTGCAALIGTIWYSLEDQKENEKRKTDAEKLARDAELFKLRQQLQPHFLFNSLNSISALAGTQPQQARKMIQQLSDFLRGTLRKDDVTQTTLKDELQHLQLYLDIEKVRFGHRLTTEIHSSPEAEDKVLPLLLLQPLVENAIKFGLYDTTEALTISIKAWAENNYLQIVIQNPFDPETSKPGQGTGFGLSSVNRRLYLLYARNDLLTTRVENNIYITTIKIPQP